MVTGQVLSNDLIVISYQGVNHEGHVRHQEGDGEQKRCAHQDGYPIQFRIAEYDFESNSEFRTTLRLN
jgi:hypothetical protein